MAKRLMITNHLMKIIALLCLTLVGCNISNEDASKYTQALIPLKGAKKIQYSKLKGNEQLGYVVEVEYPAASAITELSQKLEKLGWKPLLEDYLNPGIPSALVKGWSEFFDSTKKPTQHVHQWLAQWENGNHDILWCVLRYSYPEGSTANLRILKVILRFIPVEQAREMREVLNKEKKE